MIERMRESTLLASAAAVWPVAARATPGDAG
jgi:hypothetical protein